MTAPADRRRPPVRNLAMLALALLAAAALALWLAGREEAPDLVRGGPLLETDLGAVEGLQLTLDGVPYRFARVEASLWTLSGALEDWVDPLRLSQQLAALGQAEGGRVLPGTEPDDRRYGFNGPGSVRLTLWGAGGGEESLALGTTNPVTGNVYASGAGRPGCFPVLAETRDRLVGLPDAVRLHTILPPVPLEALDRITARHGRAVDVLAVADGRWWLRVPAVDAPEVPRVMQDYQRLYADRRRRDGEGLWLMADTRAVAGLAHEAGQLQVTSFVAPVRAAEALATWELDPPWGSVELHGPGIDPDPTSEDPDRLVVGFGPALDPQTVPAVRRGNPLLVPARAIASLEAPSGGLLHAYALTARPLLADALEVALDGRLVLQARRVDRPFRHDERSQWDQSLPPPGEREGREHLTARNFVVDLDRLPVLAALPPTDAKRVLEPEGRVEIRLAWTDPARTEVWHCGILDAGHVPGGPERLAPADGPEGPVGLWRPADGKLLQVPATVLVSARNLAR